MKYENLLNKVLKQSVKSVEFMIRSSFFKHFYEALKNRDVNDPDFQQITEANIMDVYTEFYDLFREDVNDTTILT